MGPGLLADAALPIAASFDVGLALVGAEGSSETITAVPSLTRPTPFSVNICFVFTSTKSSIPSAMALTGLIKTRIEVKTEKKHRIDFTLQSL